MFFNPQLSPNNITTSIPAPVGGLNARDSLVAMPDTDAIAMVNWWPQPYGVSVRKGYTKWASGLSAGVGTIQEWSGTDGTRKLFAWAGSNMYDVTTAGPVGTAVVTGLTSNLWSCVQFTNTAGNHLIAVNGLDDAIIYQSTGVARIVLGDGVASNTWKGIDPKNASQITVHQHRIWVVQKNSSDAWFLPPDALQGEFLKYDFGPLFSRGGYLALLSTWTIDDGSGSSDRLVALSSNGEAVVYQGTDPEEPTAWALVGVYYVGAPVAGKVGFCKAGGDLLLLTQPGVVSMAAQLTSSRVEQATDPLTSNKIQYLISNATTLYGSLAGWDMKYFPRDNLLIVNVPQVLSSGNIQYAANQLVQSWTQFEGMNATCWGTYDLSPMFGTSDGEVLKAWTGYSDYAESDGSGGTSILAKVQQAYTYFDKRATQKQVSMYRPTFVVSRPCGLNSAILYDFNTSTLTYPPTAPPGSIAVWDIAVWSSSVWGGGTQVQLNWIQAQGMGVAASLELATQSNGSVLWVSTDYSLVSGLGLF
jgi:hypothetical protein